MRKRTCYSTLNDIISRCIITVGDATDEPSIVLYVISSVSNFEIHCCMSSLLSAIADAIQVGLSSFYYCSLISILTSNTLFSTEIRNILLTCIQ